jgi:hypothetical protein
MRSVKSWMAAAAILGGAMTLSGAASAAPVSASGLAAGTASALVDTVQWGYGHRRHWRGRGWGYRPPVVCRVRYTPWGPRRVCFRRW